MNLEKQFRRLKTKQNAGTIDKLKAFINDYDGFCHIFAHEFSLVQLKEFLDMDAWILVAKNSDMVESDLDLLIEHGKEKVIILATSYSRTEVEQFLGKGATVAFASSDGFGSAYIESLITDNTKDRIRIIPDNWQEPVLASFLGKGLKLRLTSLSGLTTEEIVKLIKRPEAKGQLVIPHGGYSWPILREFAQNKGTILILNNEGLNEGEIFELIDTCKNQTQISLYDFTPNEIDTYETRGAVAVDI